MAEETHADPVEALTTQMAAVTVTDTTSQDASPAKLKLIIMRGMPGSGKSTLAATLAGETGKSFSTDDFFMTNGEYVFDGKKIGAAHQWNQKRAIEEIEKETTTPIVIDNTNMSAWEPKAYVVAGLKHHYEVEIVEPQTSWAWSVEECTKKNSHKVPQNAIAGMKARYTNYTVDDILSAQPPRRK